MGRRHASGATRAGDRVPGSHPHLDGDRGSHARGRGGRGRDRPQRAEDRCLPLDRPGRPSVNTTDSAVGSPICRPDSSSRCRTRSRRSRTAKALRVLRARLHELERAKQEAEPAAARPSQIGSGARAEKIRRTTSQTTAHRPPHQADDASLDAGPGILDEFSEALAAEDRRQALESATA